MTWTDHHHDADYARAGHYHYAADIHDAAERHHSHYDLERLAAGLREDLNRALERITDLERQHDGPVHLAVAGPDEDPEPEDYDPGPECDDEGGMSEFRYAALPGEEESW